jgi:hypothetical protein
MDKRVHALLGSDGVDVDMILVDNGSTAGASGAALLESIPQSAARIA